MRDTGISPFISDGLVIQRGKSFPIWSNEKITVNFLNKTYESKKKNGKWLVNLDPAQAGGPYTMEIKNESEIITINDICIGDVWLCSGQSNMEWQMHLIKDIYPEEWELTENREQRTGNREQAAECSEKKIINSGFMFIRHFKVPNEWDFSAPRDDINGGTWCAASNENLGDFSAVAWFFAKFMYAKLKEKEEKAIPIGLVNASWGGTPIESWMSRDALSSYPEIIADGGQYADPVRREELIKTFPEDVWIHYMPMGDYNAMIAPILKYPFTGVIWYQGESNCGRPTDYSDLFKLMITDWRKKYYASSGDRQENLPFFFVQLPIWLEESDNNENSNWALLRERQAQTLSLPATGMACALELGDKDDIHPVNKKDVGYRLFLAAEKLLFGAENTSPGPMLQKWEQKEGKLYIYFNNYGNGLKIKEFKPQSSQSTLRREEEKSSVPSVVSVVNKNIFVSIVNNEGQINLPAAIEGKDCISIDLSSVKNPKKVLYAWADNPKHRNLFNSDGLPVIPFKILL